MLAPAWLALAMSMLVRSMLVRSARIRSLLVLVILVGSVGAGSGMGRDLGSAALKQPELQQSESQPPLGAPQPDKNVRDPDFGVVARHFGLERKVEMYQWRATAQGYVRVWSAQALDSSTFAPGHANPAFPLQGKRWLPPGGSIDGKPLTVSVLETLGQWRDFRPSFDALPGNLSATFQPQGDGLGSAENPLDPQIGDLRITWRELMLPPLQDKIVLLQGRWQLREAHSSLAVAASTAVDTGTAPDRSWLPWLLGGAVVVLLLAVALARRRNRGQRLR